jgi:hypothetical protein
MEALEVLEHRASTLRAEADALTAAYQRATWLRFALVFIPIPFVIVLLRLEIESWTYFLFGGAYLGLSALLYVIDSRASDRCNAAESAATAAQEAYSQAQARQA